MLRAMLTVATVGFAASAFAADVMMIDDFEYADEAAAREAWLPDENSLPIELMPREADGGQTALKMPCNFTSRREESGHDQA